MSNSACAPGKIIISGEHSVIYGAPAIVAAVARYTTVQFTPLHRSRMIQAMIKGFPRICNYPLDSLHQFKSRLDKRFSQFLQGNLPVQHILRRPEDLVMYTLATIVHHLPVPGRTAGKGLPIPGQLSSQSEIPLGAGMGSSASAIAATLVLYEYLLDSPLTLAQRFERIRFCERLQHGQGSVVDATAVTYGGIHWIEAQTPRPMAIDLSTDWYWALQGIPSVSTGEVVSAVRNRWGKDIALWADFADCTRELSNVMTQLQSPCDILRTNHRLLQHIGVVSASAAALIADIEALGGAAKVSGAGAHKGKYSGIVLVYSPDTDSLSAVFQRHNIQTWGRLAVASQGARLC